MKQEPLSFFEFSSQFNDEDKCRDHLFKLRWPKGFVCPKCGGTSCYSLLKRNLYQCISCKHQASVTAGTIMDKTHLPLIKWFWAIYLVSTDKRGYSAVSLQNKLEISYKSAWYMLQRIRTAMMAKDWEYMLSGKVEVDEAFFGAVDQGGKRGRGSDKSKVIVALSLTEGGKPLFVKMETVQDLNSDTIKAFAEVNIKSGSIITTDGYRAYKPLAAEGFEHISEVFDPKSNKEHLKWVHTIISNAKAFISGTYHGLDKKHLQLYLAEFCYRFNRRFFQAELFNRLLFSCLSKEKLPFAELTV